MECPPRQPEDNVFSFVEEPQHPTSAQNSAEGYENVPSRYGPSIPYFHNNYARDMNDPHANEGSMSYHRDNSGHSREPNGEQMNQNEKKQHVPTYKAEEDYHPPRHPYALPDNGPGHLDHVYSDYPAHRNMAVPGSGAQGVRFMPMGGKEPFFPDLHHRQPMEHHQHPVHMPMGVHYNPEEWANVYDRGAMPPQYNFGDMREQKPVAPQFGRPAKKQNTGRGHPPTHQPDNYANWGLATYPIEKDSLKRLLRHDLSARVRGEDPQMNPALSKPSFCPDSEGKKYQLAVCGSEEQDARKHKQNKLIFVQLESDFTVHRTNEGNHAIWSYKLDNHVRDIHWINEQRIIFAQANRLGLVRLCVDHNIDELVNFPEFHSGTIREIAVCTRDKSRVISGGFDGKVFVTNIDKLVEDIQNNEKKSENSLYPCRDVVGSVRWHPTEDSLSSCTTDLGWLHIFDIRTDKRRPAPVVANTHKMQLYTHDYIDKTTVLLGYGDGTIAVLDTRNPTKLLTHYKDRSMPFKDPKMGQIGEIKVDQKTKNFAVFGTPAVTLWNANTQTAKLHCWGHHNMNTEAPSANYKTSGDFVPGKENVFGVTDSKGILSIFEIKRGQHT